MAPPSAQPETISVKSDYDTRPPQIWCRADGETRCTQPTCPTNCYVLVQIRETPGQKEALAKSQPQKTD